MQDMTTSAATSMTALSQTIPPPQPKSVGNYIGSIGRLGNRCWEAEASVRLEFRDNIRQRILDYLDGRMSCVSTRDIITVTLYMIGRRSNTAAPTILFVSENESNRKEARKLIKESDILKQHMGWKTAQDSKNPDWRARLEQLASGFGLMMYPGVPEPAAQVLYDPLQPLKHQGMALYVSHESGLRIMTANLLRLDGKAFFLAPAHAFFESANEPELESDTFEDNFEIDSDDETAIVLVADTKLDSPAIELDCFESESESESRSSSDFSEGSNIFSAQDCDNKAFSQSSSDASDILAYADTPPQKLHRPPANTFVPLGVLSMWSVDKDWALVEVHSEGNYSLSAFLSATKEDLSWARIARHSPSGATVTTHTASSGELMGVMSSTPSDICLPLGTRFQEVFSVHFHSSLAEGDCGSAVFDAVTGELYGHIVAGCRKTGFAYVMAAHHVMPDVDRAVVTGTPVLSRTTKTSSFAKVPSRKRYKLAAQRDEVQKRTKAVRTRRDEKKWPKQFSQIRPFVDKEFFEDRNVLLEKGTEVLEEFYVDFESSIPSWDISVVREFFENQTVNDLGSQRQGRAKVDGRCRDTELRRNYPTWLTPAELEHHLGVKRFNHANHPYLDVDRQLVYIYRLDPQYILALIRTAYRHQLAALRDTIWQHIAHEASMRVKIPIDGFRTYLLEFHVPFLTLRCPAQLAADLDPCVENSEPGVADLIIKCNKHKQMCKCIVREANVSVVVCGWDHSKWTSWTFSNTHSDPTARHEEEPDENCMEEDYSGTDGNGPEDGVVINASEPIWGAREYWLRVVNLRMRIIHKEWKWLVLNTEATVRTWDSKNPLLCQTEVLSSRQREKAEAHLNQTVQTMNLLRLLSDKLGLALQAFAQFEGDTSYFSDLLDDHEASLFDSLYETFDKLVGLQNKLESLQKSCENTERIIQLLMATIGNQLNSDTREHAREAHKVNLATNEVSNAMAQLNRKSTQAAVESSRTTRINVQLFLITVPFVLALQYFGSEKDIFSFEKNPRTFSYAICILFCALPLLTYGLSFLNQRWDKFSNKHFGKAESKVDHDHTSV